VVSVGQKSQFEGGVNAGIHAPGPRRNKRCLRKNWPTAPATATARLCSLPDQNHT
jgi:hypothetical protein